MHAPAFLELRLVPESTSTHFEMKGGRWRRRTMTVVAAVGAAVIAYYVETKALRLELVTPQTPALRQESMVVTINSVVGVAGAAALAAWVFMAILERITTKARGIWTVIAIIVLLLSLGGPFSGTGISLGQRIGLAALHLLVGIVLIPLIPDWPPKRVRAMARRS